MRGTEAGPAVWRRGSLWAGGAVTVIGAVVLAGAAQIAQPGAFADPLGPRAFPLALGGALLVAGGLLAAAALLPRTGAAAEPARLGQLRPVAVVSGAILLYIVAMSWAGFLLTTLAFLVGLFRYLGERRWWLAAAVAAGVAGGVYLLFTRALGVALPVGLVGF